MFEEIGSSFEEVVSERHTNYLEFIVEINSFEQIPDVVASLEKTLNLVPPMPIKDTDSITRPTPYITFNITGESLNWVFSPSILFPMTGEITPGNNQALVYIYNEVVLYDWDEVLVSLENAVATYLKWKPDTEFQIPREVLLREPPRSFNSVMFVMGDEMKEISGLLVSWEGGGYTFPASIFYGRGGFFVKMVSELGGSHEYISFEQESFHLKWEISGDVWEAYNVDGDINITKNGEILPVMMPGRPCIRDIELLLGVRAEYTNDVAVLYLIKE
jgi:hypothetical protein